MGAESADIELQCTTKTVAVLVVCLSAFDMYNIGTYDITTYNIVIGKIF